MIQTWTGTFLSATFVIGAACSSIIANIMYGRKFVLRRKVCILPVNKNVGVRKNSYEYLLSSISV